MASLIRLSQKGCYQQHWKWTVKVTSSPVSCIISSFETSWNLRLSSTPPYSYSSRQHGSRGSPNIYQLNLELCLFGGAEFSEISYDIEIHQAEDSSKKPVSEPIGTYKGNKFFHRNSFDILPESIHGRSNVTSAAELEIKISITTLQAKSVVTIPPNTFSSDFREAIESNEEFQDVTLIVGQEDIKEEIKASKFMLMARSPVFAQMFQADMKEKNSNVVEIPNVSPHVFKVMLSYIYCGFVTHFLSLDETISLMDTAMQYELQHLGALCKNRLAISLTTENAAHILVVAETYSCPELKQEAIEYITQSNEMCRNVMQTNSWGEVERKLMEEVLKSSVDPSPKKRKLVVEDK